jgi:hypothetical protein
MRRESSTVVALVGTLSNELTTAFGRSPNVAVIPPSAGKAQPPEDVRAGPDRPGWEAGALAMREAARRRATYVLVPDDPLAPVAAAWQAMWDLPSGPAGAAEFERRASEALAGPMTEERHRCSRTSPSATPGASPRCPVPKQDQPRSIYGRYARSR